jgi:response regulator RpfG family c-di-GMP phosphodiesterase
MMPYIPAPDGYKGVPMSPAHIATPADDELIFAEEEPVQESAAADAHWTLLIVDDEEDVHTTTRLVLEDFTFDGIPLRCISAYTGAQAMEILRTEKDIAVVLLDVVMESNHAGLHVARAIREELDNRLVRIILRTGQPGQAPERKVIISYDINDYKHKAELTSQRLFTTVYTALRSYRDLRVIEQNRQGLRHIIDASADLFRIRSIRQLAQGVLTQLSSLYGLFSGSVYVQTSGFTATSENHESLQFIAATGKYDALQTDEGCPQLSSDVRAAVQQAVEEKRSIFNGRDYVGYFPARNGREHLIYLEGLSGVTPPDENLLQVFTNNVAVAFDNVYLNKEIINTQKEVILRLGDVVESRSKETAHHVRRVAEFTRLLARAAGLGEETAELYLHASPMHDVGKIGIPDAILLKPGRLTDEEREVMKTHTTIGYHILNTSERPIMQAAAIIAHEHHERWDGTGYPQGLKGDGIHIAGRITCLADIFDALSSKRVYKEAWPQEKVLDYIQAEKGRIFDPALVDALFANMEEIDRIRDKYQDAH